MSTVEVHFPNEQLARQWLLWLEEVGEQEYWTYCSLSGQPALVFDYDYTRLIVTGALAPTGGTP